MPRGRPEKPARREIIWRAPEVMLAELYALNPKLLDSMGQARYGAMQDYLTSLVNQDIAKRRAEIQQKAVHVQA